jgi:hypothetical protein
MRTEGRMDGWMDVRVDRHDKANCRVSQFRKRALKPNVCNCHALLTIV